jgi:hypothetical protein
MGMHHIAKNDGIFFEPNRSIPLFSFKQSEKIGGGVIISPMGVRYAMGRVMKVPYFTVDPITIYRSLHSLKSFIPAFLSSPVLFCPLPSL